MTSAHAVPIVALIGATASGKSALSMAVARALGGVELLSADSMQVYRGFDIGTAKPTLAERAEVPHHVVDLVEPHEEFSVADFAAAYGMALADVTARGRRAVVVGGTGLYLRAVTDGLDLPGSWPELREELESLAVADPHTQHERLVTLDPLAAARMEPTNARRIARALEVCIGSGRPFSSYGPGLEGYGESRVVQIGLRWDREALTRRIADRVAAMLDAGLLEEVRQLRAAPRPWSRTASQALGYRELAAHVAGSVSLDEAVEQIRVRTRQFAVRQDRWFRRDPRIRWIDVRHDPVDEALPVVMEAVGA